MISVKHAVGRKLDWVKVYPFPVQEMKVSDCSELKGSGRCSERLGTNKSTLTSSPHWIGDSHLSKLHYKCPMQANPCAANTINLETFAESLTSL